MDNPNIRIIDMHIRDERALEILKSSLIPGTQFSSMEIGDLAEILKCHRNTASAIIKRLQGAGYVRKDLSRSHRYTRIEVLDVSSSTER